MHIGRWDVEAWRGDRLWVGTDPLYPGEALLLTLSSLADGRIYEEARLVSRIPVGAPFKLVDIIVDARHAKAGYAMVIPARPRTLEEGASGGDVVAIARELARTVLVLHKAGLAYRSFTSDSFLLSGGQVVPCDFSRASRLEDAPDADGILTDVYGLGTLLAELDPGRSQLGPLIGPMTAAEPMSRPRSLETVLADLE